MPDTPTLDLSRLTDAEIEALLPTGGLGEIPGLETEYARRAWQRAHLSRNQGGTQRRSAIGGQCGPKVDNKVDNPSATLAPKGAA